MHYLTVVEFCFPDRPSGAARVAWDVAQAMRRRGHAVTLICYCPDDASREGLETVAGIEVLRFRKAGRPAWHPGRLRAIVDSAAAACRRWLADRHFDVVHVHSPNQGLGVREALGARPRYIYTAHSPMVREQDIVWRAQGATGRLKLLLGRPLLARVERRIFAAAAGIQTLSAYTRAVLDQDYGVGPRISVIPHWYAPRQPLPGKAEARRALGWPLAPKIFLTVRSLGPRYGIDVAIRALGPLTQESDCHFYIGGSGELRAELEALAARYRGDEERIHFLGRLSDEDLPLAYAAADLFILPTLALECFGLIITEALSYGCPVLGTDAGAIPEALQPILPDFIVPAGDVAALQSRAQQFLAGRLPMPDRQALCDHAARTYDEETVMSRLLQLFGAPA
jgi:glycosyltransferase involved in cell wall biosynthesis